MKLLKKLEKYYSKHVWYAKGVNVLTGIGIGVLITYPFVGVHPVRVGLVLVGLGILGSLYPLFKK